MVKLDYYKMHQSLISKSSGKGFQRINNDTSRDQAVHTGGSRVEKPHQGQGQGVNERYSWHIKDTHLLSEAMPDPFQDWPNGYVKLVYSSAVKDAASHQSGWAMRNTNNHDRIVLKKSCLGVMVCSEKCDVTGKKDITRMSHHPPVLVRPFICDKARREQPGSACPTESCPGRLVHMKCGGHAGKPVTHVWRTHGQYIYFQAKGIHDHPQPEKKLTVAGRRLLGLLPPSRHPRSAATRTSVNKKQVSLAVNQRRTSVIQRRHRLSYTNTIPRKSINTTAALQATLLDTNKHNTIITKDTPPETGSYFYAPHTDLISDDVTEYRSEGKQVNCYDSPNEPLSCMNRYSNAFFRQPCGFDAYPRGCTLGRSFIPSNPEPDHIMSSLYESGDRKYASDQKWSPREDFLQTSVARLKREIGTPDVPSFRSNAIGPFQYDVTSPPANDVITGSWPHCQYAPRDSLTMTSCSIYSNNGAQQQQYAQDNQPLQQQQQQQQHYWPTYEDRTLRNMYNGSYYTTGLYC